MTANPEKAHPGWPSVVVTGAYLTGIVLMRNLKRRGLSVSIVDNNADQPGFRSVYGKAYQCPDPDEDPQGWLSFMTDLALKTGGGQKPVLIPSADKFVSAIARHSAGLATHYTFCHASATVQEILATKRRQYEVAGQHGLAVPRTQLIASEADLEAFTREARFPCLLKPLHAREWERFPVSHPLYGQKLVTADSAGEILAHYRSTSGVSPEMIVQEIIEGPDTAKLVYLSCYSLAGERIGHCILRQLRTTPIRFGSASIVEPVEDPETAAVCDRFLKGVSYRGLCEIELKRDTRDGVIKMIEANPRYSVTADAGGYAGVDLGWLHYLDLIGQKVTPAIWSGHQFRHIFLQRDAMSFRSYLSEGLTSWPKLLWSYRPPVAFFDFDAADWKVTSKNLEHVAKLLAGPTFRRFFPKPSQ